MKLTSIAVVISVSILGAGAYILGGRSHRERPASAPDPSAARGDEATERLEEQNARLAGDLAMVKARVAQLGADPRSAVTTAMLRDASGAMPAPSPSTAELRARDEQHHRTFLANVATRFEREALDPKWSTTATTTLRGVLDADDVKLQARNIDCRNATCRVELANTGPSTQEGLASAAMRLTTTLPNMVIDHSANAGDGILVVYYSTQPFAVSGE